MAVEGSHATGPGIKELFTGIHLLIVMAIIFFAGRKGVMAMVRNRSRDIEKEIVDARVELEKMRHETDRARQEITQISATRDRFLQEIRTEGDKLYKTMVAEAQQTSSRILADAKLAAEAEVQGAMSRLKEEVVNRAVQRAVTLVSESNDTRTQIHGKLFDRLSADITSHTGDIKNGI